MNQLAYVLGCDTQGNPVAVRVISPREATRLAAMLTAEALAARRSGARAGFAFLVLAATGEPLFIVHGDPLPPTTDS